MCVLALAHEHGVIRPRDVAALGFAPGTVLHRLVRKGQLERSGRGLYSLVGAQITEHHTLVEAAKHLPSGVVCLLSALRFHDLGTQWPHEIWLAIDRPDLLASLRLPLLPNFPFLGRGLQRRGRTPHPGGRDRPGL